MIERGLCDTLGGSELSLRLLPLALGCASVVMFAVLARRLLSLPIAMLAVAMFAFSDRLIWHAVEVKQYGTDVFFALLLMLAAFGSQRAAHRPLRRLVVLSVLSAICLWFSYATAFVFAGLSLALMPSIVRRGARAAAAYALCNLLVAASFLVLLRTVIAAQQTGSLEAYWAEHFIDLRHPLTWPIWLGRHVFSLFNYPIAPAGAVLLPLSILGIVWLIHTRRLQTLAMLVNPFALNIIAAAAHRYPFDGERLTVYLAPALFLLAGFGTKALYAWAGSPMKRWAPLPAAAVCLIAAGLAAWHLVVPRYRGHVRPAVQFVRSHLEAGDGIYSLQYREFQCYWPPDDPRVRTIVDPADQVPFRRFWIVSSYPNDPARRRYERTMTWARTFADLKLSFSRPGGSAYLFEMRNTPPPHSLPPDISTHHKSMSRLPMAPDT